MRQDRPRILLRDERDLTPEEEHEADLGPHECGVLVADAGPAVGLHHRPVEERVRRLIEVEKGGDESAREKCAGDLSRAWTATPGQKLPHDEHVGQRDEDRVADERRGVRQGRSVGQEDRGRHELDVSGLAVAPGFINVLSWAIPSLFADGRAQSDVRQGVTLEVFGEGSSMGPLTDAMRRDQIERQTDIKYDIPWTTLREGLDHLVRLGVSVNVASFVGATTLRVHEVGYDDRPTSAGDLERLRRLAREAAADGALGLGSALIYTPGTFASTDELAALAEAAGGTYISHLRNEGERLVEAIDELIEIARIARVRGEIYHLKQAGTANWSKLPAVIERVERARAGGVDITADMYPYTAGATGLHACMPAWVQAGGFRAWLGRLREPSLRKRVEDEMRAPGRDWEDLYIAAGGADGILLVSFKNDALKPLTGKTLADVAKIRGL